MPSGKQIRFRPIAAARYQGRLPRLGPKHGSDWDCNKECRICEPYRVIERQYWDSLSEQEKAEVRFFKYAVA